MNYTINDEIIKNSDEYKNFMRRNSGYGTLNVRAYAANQAIPISNMRIIVTTLIGDKNVIFFEGRTNSSGVIEGITLPAPRINDGNLDAPIGLEYKINAYYEPDNIGRVYSIKIYENISVIQNISIIPRMNLGGM